MLILHHSAEGVVYGIFGRPHIAFNILGSRPTSKTYLVKHELAVLLYSVLNYKYKEISFGLPCTSALLNS